MYAQGVLLHLCPDSTGYCVNETELHQRGKAKLRSERMKNKKKQKTLSSAKIPTEHKCTSQMMM